MEVHYETVECPDHEDPASHRAVFRRAHDGTSLRLSLNEVNAIFNGEAEQDGDFSIPNEELKRAQAALMPVFRPAEF